MIGSALPTLQKYNEQQPVTGRQVRTRIDQCESIA